jgi:signal transduction histidine kinase
MSTGSKSIWIALGIGVIGLLGFVAMFASVDHRVRAERFSTEFEAQHREALESEDAFGLATRLSAMISSPEIFCAEGVRRGHPFFHSGPSPCTGWGATSEIRSSSGQVHIRVVHRIPRSTWALAGLSVLAALFLATMAVLVTRSLTQVRDRHEREIRDLALRVAHDIRGPLLALRMGSGDKTAIESLEGIAERLLVRFRILAKEDSLQEVQAAHSPKSSCLKAKIDAWIEENRSRWSALEIENSIASGMRTELEAVDLEVILGNLISNSNEAGSPRVEILALEEEREIRLGVRDWGRGFSVRARKGFGSPGLTEGKTGGTGLGLASLREWVGKWGGEVSLDPMVKQGALVWVRLRKA